MIALGWPFVSLMAKSPLFLCPKIRGFLKHKKLQKFYQTTIVCLFFSRKNSFLDYKKFAIKISCREKLNFSLVLLCSWASLQPLKNKAFENSMGKGENAGYQHLLVSHVFILSKRNFSFLVTFYLFAFNLDKAKLLPVWYPIQPSTKHWWVYMTLGEKPFENIVGKRENPGNHIFTFSHNVFHCIKEKVTTFNSIPNDKILNWSKFKALADYKINVVQKIEICWWEGRKHCGERSKCW